MALGVGIALTVGGRNASENSFGLIALCSVGPVVAVLALSMMARGAPRYSRKAKTSLAVRSAMGLKSLPPSPHLVK